jgi:phage-related protein
MPLVCTNRFYQCECLRPSLRASAPPRDQNLSLPNCIKSDTHLLMKPIAFLGDSLGCLQDFPDDARSTAGFQLREVQKGNDPTDWKPIKTIGSGVREIRIREASGAFRIIYLASFKEQVVVLHAFQKKTQKTSQKDIDLAAVRLKLWKGQT